MQTLLNVNNLSVNFDTTQGIFTAVDDVSFYINKGECLGIAGESGSGKTQTFFSITGILSDNGSVSGNAYFNNIDLLRLNEKEISKIRGKQIGFIFQDPMTSLNPYMKIKKHQSVFLKILQDELNDLKNFDLLRQFCEVHK